MGKLKSKAESSELNAQLFVYVTQVINNNITCREVYRWLKNNSCSVESFFIATTLIKYGALEDNKYQSVVEDFLNKYVLELKQTYSSPRFSFAYQSPEQSPLYQEIINSLDSLEPSEGLTYI